MTDAPEPESRPRTMKESDMLAITLQSVALGMSISLNAVVFGRRFLDLSIAAAVSCGLLAGILAAFPAVRIVARDDGVELSFAKWLLVAAISASVAYASAAALGLGTPLTR